MEVITKEELKSRSMRHIKKRRRIRRKKRPIIFLLHFSKMLKISKV
tara:strand:+ start:242 stop:379 length:138 start_codon:yes stop_codon:yes gene_type:complete